MVTDEDMLLSSVLALWPNGLVPASQSRRLLFQRQRCEFVRVFRLFGSPANSFVLVADLLPAAEQFVDKQEFLFVVLRRFVLSSEPMQCPGYFVPESTPRLRGRYDNSMRWFVPDR